MTSDICKLCVLIAVLDRSAGNLTLKYLKVNEEQIIYYTEDLQLETSAFVHVAIYETTGNKTLNTFGTFDEGYINIAQSVHLELVPDQGEIKIALSEKGSDHSTPAQTM